MGGEQRGKHCFIGNIFAHLKCDKEDLNVTEDYCKTYRILAEMSNIIFSKRQTLQFIIRNSSKKNHLDSTTKRACNYLWNYDILTPNYTECQGICPLTEAQLTLNIQASLPEMIQGEEIFLDKIQHKCDKSSTGV